MPTFRRVDGAGGAGAARCQREYATGKGVDRYDSHHRHRPGEGWRRMTEHLAAKRSCPPTEQIAIPRITWETRCLWTPSGFHFDTSISNCNVRHGCCACLSRRNGRRERCPNLQEQKWRLGPLVTEPQTSQDRIHFISRTRLRRLGNVEEGVSRSVDRCRAVLG